MKIWVDDVCKPPRDIEGFEWFDSIGDLIEFIMFNERLLEAAKNHVDFYESTFGRQSKVRKYVSDHNISVIDISGKMYENGRFLNWMTETGRSYHICTH